MQKSLALLAAVGVAIGTLAPCTASCEGPLTYEDHVRNIKEMQSLTRLTEAERDEAIRNYIKILRNNRTIESNITDTNARLRGPGDRSPATAPKTKAPDTYTPWGGSVSDVKSTDILIKCFEKCFANGIDGSMCCTQCLK